jgi:hypothetical protein
MFCRALHSSHTFLLWDFPDLCCDCCLQFTNCLRIVLIHIILEIPPQIKIWGVQVWWMHYVAVLMKFWVSLGRRRCIDRDEQWFRQDGAIPHTTNDSLAWLRERFKDRLISRKCEIEWVAHSPDLNPPPHIFICGGISRIMCMRTILKQLVNWRKQSQQRSGKSLRRNVCESLTILRDACKCTFNAEDAIWSTF